MEVLVQFLSFFVIRTEGTEGSGSKQYKHYRTMNGHEYMESELRPFLDEEFVRIVKRKAERHPVTGDAPTKIGRFVVEPGHEPDSNPNFNLLNRLRRAEDAGQFHGCADDLVRLYLDTSAARGGALIVAQARLPRCSGDPFVFVMKCDFEPKIARIADERSLIAKVDMAISARGMKSIQYPHMPEEGIVEEWELKLHQASHARYFEDFLKWVEYGKPMPEVMEEQVLGMVQQYMEEKWGDQPAEAREREEEEIELWAAADKRGLLERWPEEQVAAAAAKLVEQKPDLPIAFKLGGVTVKGLLSEFGNAIHLARHNGKYIVVIEGDAFQFDRGMSPVELLHPPELAEIMERIGGSSGSAGADAVAEAAVSVGEDGDARRVLSEAAAAGEDDAPPW
ncbi:hypothetical protein IJ21_22850 [Paenibacillus sp. 32O-W]|uniref:DUF3900 domain-containing protein n=1 Tax=Paenibacillus sp. 32O-W TaxID=1695218 RepID=UPI000721008E|nr:DUF3900 domain-containing protein [Paenibacillus sp. 32O-W]ALS27682.1 hypothetical protein IJ21_22850 [Paenibacillus sp. 32O-W]